MNRKYTTIMALLAAGLLWQTAAAQSNPGMGQPIRGVVLTAEQLAVPGDKTAVPRPGAVAPPGAPGTPSPVQEDKNPRLTALLRLGFDRRSETILNAWSRSLLPETEEPERKAEEREPSAAVPPLNADQIKKQDEAKATAEEARRFAQWVTMGQWGEVGKYLAHLPKADARKVYEHLLDNLRQPASNGQGRGPFGPSSMRTITIAMPGGGTMTRVVPEPGGPMSHSNRSRQANVLTTADLVGLIEAAPCKFNRDRIQKMASLFPFVTENGHLLDPLVRRLEQGLAGLGGTTPQGRAKAAWLFLLGHQLDACKPFLPDPSDLAVRQDVEQLELLANYMSVLYNQDHKPKDLALSWELDLALSAHPEVKTSVREEALMRLAGYSTKVAKERGRAWLEESFTREFPRGIRLLTLFGSRAATNLQHSLSNPAARLEQLRLQNVAAEALVRVQPTKAKEWSDTLSRLAEHWIREAVISQTYTHDSSQQLVQRWDNYGNIYYTSADEMQQMGMMGDQNQPQPIAIRELLDIRPSPQWIEHVAESLRPRFAIACAELLLKNHEDKESFPYIEQIARSQPHVARRLVHQFLRAWTMNHDPNSLRRMYNPYVYIYGYNEQADTIPLTRSKQQRNLAELKEWLVRIRQLPIEPIDETLLADAFTTCHSSAEVYRLASFEEVFGDLGQLKPETVARIGDVMRRNLTSVWRKVETQEALKTKRKKADVEREVLRGYDVAISVTEQSQKAHPDNWLLQLQLASLHFDRNAYAQSVKKSSEFVARRDQAFAMFAKAADLYRQKVPDLDRSKQESTVYDSWFYAALGSRDLQFVSHENSAEPKQYPLIRAALLALPGPAADHHLGEFANHLYSHMASVQPQAKFRYIRGGLQIVGHHPRSREARQSLEYYEDVVTELQLATRIDGSDNVGHGTPFGVFVSLRHTTEMERESGGFEKYVQNQNAGMFFYNYGRPPENYRDKFEEAAIKTLSEHFDVISVTFENPKYMRSRPTDQEGWRETPLAYILLKAKGSQVDRLPPLELNLDFLDSTGFVVIPIASAAIPLDCSRDEPVARPMSNLALVQTLDERQASEGKLVLEVKATAAGLIPDLGHLIDLTFPGFDAKVVDDQGSIPSEFDSKSEEVRVLTDRSWTVELMADESTRGDARTFQFANATIPAKVTFQRYEDADLVPVDRNIALEHRYGNRRWPLAQTVVGLGLLGLVIVGFGLWWRQSRTREGDRPRYELPRDVNPFTVLNLLDCMARDDGLDSRTRDELQSSIQHVQRHYFSRANGDASIDLKQLAQRWTERLT